MLVNSVGNTAVTTTENNPLLNPARHVQPRPPLALVKPERSVLSEADPLIGTSQHVAALREFIAAQANQTQPVLLIGEAGLRQEQLARVLHQVSDQRQQPLMTVNAHGLSDEALHTLLFGKLPGSTAASYAPQTGGMLASCAGGTVFINELTKLPALVQQRLASHIEEQRWRAHGHALLGHPLPRLIFATQAEPTELRAENRIAYGLIEMCKAHSFRLKPLRERSEDIGLLAQQLVARIAARLNKGEHQLTSEALQVLSEYNWEGNIDELEAVLTSVITLAPPQAIRAEALPARLRLATLRAIPDTGVDLPKLMDDYERTLIETALRQMSGNQTKAAQLLGLRVQTLNMKLKRFKELGMEVRW